MEGETDQAAIRLSVLVRVRCRYNAAALLGEQEHRAALHLQEHALRPVAPAVNTREHKREWG